MFCSIKRKRRKGSCCRIKLDSALVRIQRREYYRLSCIMPASLRTVTDIKEGLDEIQDFILNEDNYKCTIVDISGGGIRAFSKRQLEKNELVYVKFTLNFNSGDKETDVLAKVVDSQKNSKDETMFDSRLQFINISEADREEIVKYVFEQQRNMLKRSWAIMAKKILVIDDSALMRRVISDIINESDEYEVAAIAKDGLEGLDMIVSHPYEYSAIILDINMPKLNGLELLKRLQKDHIEQTVIVVSTVAKEGAKETIQALEYGAFDFVTKPENYLETKSIDFKNKIFNMLNVATNSRSSLRRASMRTGSASSARSTGTFRKPEDSSKPFLLRQEEILTVQEQ